MRFENREHAGRLLAARLDELREARPVVLALSRGGVPIAYEVAHDLEASLDVIVVRKIRADAGEGSTIGAIAEGGVTYFIPAAAGGERPEDVLAGESELIADLARRARLYRGVAPAPRLAGRTVVLVDDFVETGATALAGARAVRRRGAARVLLATPVVAAAVEPALRREFEAVVALVASAGPGPLSASYERLEPVSDAAALAYLRRWAAASAVFPTVEALPVV